MSPLVLHIPYVAGNTTCSPVPESIPGLPAGVPATGGKSAVRTCLICVAKGPFVDLTLFA